MNGLELIGKVGALYLHNQIVTEDNEGTARFIVDCLTADQTAAIAKAILEDGFLKEQIDIKLPVHFLEGQDLPAFVLTNERATYFRNAACPKPALLIANTGDDEEQGLRELVPIGAPQLQGRPDLWVSIAAEGLPLSPDHLRWWEKALRGLQELRFLSLGRFANYVLDTRLAIHREGETVITALGAALPALRLPRDTYYFNGLNDKVRGHASRWRNLYDSANKKRACFLLKLTPAQLLLSEDELRISFERVQDSIPEADHERVNEFITAPSGWNEAAERLAECEWEAIKPLFDGLRREKFNLGQATLTFYDELEPELLSESDNDYLRRLIARKTTQSEEEDELFYDSHRGELKGDRKLKSAWDRFVFGKPRESDDFLVGLTMCFETLFSQVVPGSKRNLKIRCDRATKKDLKELNVDAGLYFVRRYKGLRNLFRPRVSWEVGHLFEYEDLVDQWKAAKRPTINRSVAKAALQLKFVLELELELPAGGSETHTAQLQWKFDPNRVPSEMFEDWSRLVEHPLVYCKANREAISTKGQLQTVDLFNVKTFVPAFGQDRGSFVAIYKKANNIALHWLENLEEARAQGSISTGTAQKLAEEFENFKDAYSSAVSGFSVNGLANKQLIPQLEAYADLLHTICKEAKGDSNRELLLRPLLQIGVVAVEGGNSVSVVAPWHPLRLAAMRQKAFLVAGLMHHLLTAEELHFGDARLFFKEIKVELEHPFYPELVLGWQGSSPQLLALTDVAGDYSLHEPPLATDDGVDTTNENPTEAATRVMDLVKRYLKLYPHEQANLSVVLYNSDSARLPQAVVDRIGTMHEDDDDVRCQIILRHRDSKRLRSLYEKIVETSGMDGDAFNASEATRDFMARLRIGIMADQAPVPTPRDGFPADIVFSQDVIARHARLEWYYENARPIERDKLVPAHWSRRRPAAKDDMKSIVYLCCPVQTREGWAYLTAITSFLKDDWTGDEERRLLPVRQLNFQDTNTAQIFEETHNLANWVVNYDELLDRRQLLNQNVKVIRYKQSATQGRNVVISSKAPLGLLRSMVFGRLKDLNLDLGDDEYQLMTERFIQDANDVSGDIVLRAAKRGRNASELIGIVLSRFLIRHELGVNRYYGWYFLDDYAEWLGQQEERIADIMVLSPELSSDGVLRLAIVIAESKYIDISNLGAKRKESQKQLRDTVRRVNDALFGSPERLDRNLWLARLSDLILDGVQFPAHANINLTDWRRAIREGECEVYVRGYSHVFVAGPSDAADCTSFAQVAEAENSYQEIFGRAQVRDLVMKYHADQDPTLFRQSLADDNIWEFQSYVRPSDRIETLVKREPESPNKELTRTEVTKEAEEGAQSTGVKADLAGSSEDSTVTASTDSKAQPISTGKVTQEVGTRWSYPGIEELLQTSKQSETVTAKDEAWLRSIESQTKGALQQFQLNSKLKIGVLTPNSALLKFTGSSNLTVEQVLKHRSQFLTTHGLNIISVQPEPNIVAIAIERPQRQVIKIQDLWATWEPDSAAGNQSLLIGVREDDGKPLFLSPSKEHAPHTLIAGSTGSGKSVLMQNIILGIAATNRPHQAKIIVIDPKQGVDYFQLDPLPHLQGGIIDDQEQALRKMHALVEEMDGRYKKFRTARAQNLSVYNQTVSESDRLPVIWLIHDEFAEWMMVEDYKEEVSSVVGRLGVKARAAGIYLVFAAQRPDANVMPMQLRANLGNRLILRVDSEGTSEIALGDKGAERLLGKGHLLAKLEGEPSLSYAQVPLVDNHFMENLVLCISQEELSLGHRKRQAT